MVEILLHQQLKFNEQLKIICNDTWTKVHNWTQERDDLEQVIFGW